MAATAAKTNLAPARVRDGDLFTALGIHRQRYFFRSAGRVLWWSAGDLCRVGSALALLPDIDHWRGLYPAEGGKAGAVDWERCGAGLIALATAAGDYQPKPGEGPGDPGRPKLSDEERQRRKAERQVIKGTPPAHVIAGSRQRRG